MAWRPGLVVTAAQLALLGNAATWALGFLAGPGFAVALGSTVTPAAAVPGLLPLVPVLGAMPEAADYPPIMYAVLLLPVAAGALLGRGVDRELEFFGDVRARVTATVVTALLAALVVVGVAALGNGALGVDRLSAVGVPLGAFALALVLEVVAGALLWLGAVLLREWLSERARSASDSASDSDSDSGSDSASDSASASDSGEDHDAEDREDADAGGADAPASAHVSLVEKTSAR